MADSTQSDADKIRMKRLAKLGGAQGSTGTSSPISNGAATPSQPASAPMQPTATSPPPHQPKKTQTPPMTRKNSMPQIDLDPDQVAKPAAPQIKVHPRPKSAAKRERDGSEKSQLRQAEGATETPEVWQDKMLRQVFRVTLKEEEFKDLHGHSLIFLTSTKEDLTDQGAPSLLNVEILEGAITEAASHAPNGKPFEYLLACFKRVSRAVRNAKFTGPEDPKHGVYAETKRLCMSYCVFAVAMPEMFGEDVPPTNPLVEHMLAEPECDIGICTDFLNEASARFDEDDTVKEAIVGAAEELSRQLATENMLDDDRPYIRGFRNLLRYPKIADAITKSPAWLPDDVQPQEIETKTLLGPMFRRSPMQLDIATSYFSAPTTRDREFIANAQNAVRMTLRTHQAELFAIVDTIIRSGQPQRARVLDWFAACMNKNHKRRAMRVDYKTVSSDGFMVNVTNVLDQLCEPFMDARFGKIERIDVDYLRRNPRVDIADETKINADQKTSDEFYARKAEGGSSNFISEIFFLAVAAHHYGTEAAQTRMSTLKKTVQRMQKDLEAVESERHKYISDPRYLARFEDHVKKLKKSIDDNWSIYHATNGVLLDDLMQARSMQFMRYVIVWLLRLASGQDLPRQNLKLPLPADQPDVFKCLPEYFLEDVVDNFKFITSNIPQIITPQQCEEIVQICVTFLRNSEWVKNPGVKSGLVTILFYGVHPFYNHTHGVLGNILIGSSFANEHLLHALMKFYIEAESTGAHTQFYDKFNIRYEIFQVIKCIWTNTLYRENLQREATVNTDFFVQFVNMLVNDVTFVLDESLSAFVKIHDLTKELASWLPQPGDEERRKEREELLEEQKGKAKSYMQLTRETMETLILFTDTLAEAFTMPEIVTRLADMLDYNLDTMVGPKRTNLRVENRQEYGWDPNKLLSDILTVYCNLAGKQNFIQAIARDGRSYKPVNFAEATRIMSRFAMKSSDEIRVWECLAARVAETRLAEEAEEADLGEIPDEFLDPLLSDLMKDPVLLPVSKNVVDRSTIRSHLLSDAHDPFNRTPLRIEDVIPDTELKGRIERWKADRLAARRAEKEGVMDTSAG